MAGAALVAAASSSPALGVVSQGVFRMGADASWARGITGAATQVAVLDQGFGGLAESIAAGELPPLSSMETRSFDPVHGLEGRDNLGGRTQHGTRMAEIVHDVAPGARLVLVNYDDIGGFVRAVEWIAASGIPVVSHSNSLLGGPFDGSGVLAQAVNGAAARGVLWVNSSGNFGERHWRGVPGPAGTEIPISPRPGETMAFGLGWSGAGAEAVLLVQRLRGDGSWAEVARSDRTRRTPPVAVDGGAWRLVVMRTAGAEVPVDVFSRTVGFGAAATADGSVATPGDALGSLSVGAVSWRGTAPERYSSRGPPRMVAPSPTWWGPRTSRPIGSSRVPRAPPHPRRTWRARRRSSATSGSPPGRAATCGPCARRSCGGRSGWATARRRAQGWRAWTWCAPACGWSCPPGGAPW